MKVSWLALIVLPALLLAGCATDIMTQRDRAQMAGRFGQLEQLAEAEVPDMRRAKTVKLAPLCFAYAKAKRYNKLMPCLDQLEKNVANGDTNMTDLEAMQKQSPLMMGFAFMGAAMSGVKLEQDVTPFLWEARAETYMDLREYGRAIEYGGKMYANIPTQWNLERYSRIRALGVLSLAYALAGDRANALKRAQELEQTGTSYPYTLLKTDKQVWLARTYLALGEYQRAYEIISVDDNSFFRAMADMVSGGAALEGGSLFAYQQIQRRFMLHKSELETGRLKEAKAGYDEMLKDPATQENGDIYWIVLYDRGRIAEREGNAAEAAEFYKRAVEIIEQQRSTLNTEASKIGFVGDKQAVYGQLIVVLVERGLAGEALSYVERSKSRALVDMLASKKDFTVQAPDPEKVRLVLAQLDSADLVSRVQGDTVKPGVSAGVRNLQLVQQQIKHTAPELSTLVTVSSVPSDELKGLVGESEALVEYYYQGKELYVFVVNRAQLRVVKLDATGLAEQVQRFRRAIENPNSNLWEAQAQALYGRLWQPIETMVSARNVIVVAHGALHYLPFAALRRPDGGLLMDQYGLRFLPSASVLKFLRPAVLAKDAARLLAIGNPDLGDSKLDLQFAEGEARLVAGMTANSRLLVRKDATETNFRKAGGVFSRIHIASHGKFQADDPLSSGLYLARDAENDGVLTVGELYSMNLDADLVTLSACETGLGKIANGDDVVGLTRGFLYAGSRSIVASLWSVDDRATATLMQAFYTNLAGMNKQEALRQAQINARKSFPHPFYWAAFQLTGRAE
ncbi:MAG: CHAT domain-containing protein [Sulfuricaulis sp.]|nr:CHAT domain-containing protein [Sulfuricaulis sp.]